MGRRVQRVRGSDPAGEQLICGCPAPSAGMTLTCFCCQIIIENRPTAVPPGGSHFNMEGSPVEGKDVWDVKKLLEVKQLTPVNQNISDPSVICLS